MNLRRNLITNLISFVTTTASYFIVYRLIVHQLGSEALGTWSMIFSFLIVISSSAMGINSTIINKIITNSEKNCIKFQNELLYNSFILYSIIFLCFSIMMIGILYFFLDKILFDNLKLIFIVISGIYFNINTFSFTAFLDANNENYLKNISSIISFVLFILVSYVLITKLRLNAIGVAYFIQSFLFFCISALLVKKRYSVSLRRNFKKDLLFSLWSGSWKIQLISLLTIVYDPITKFFLVKNSTLTFIAVYEIGNRLVSQVRNLIVTSNQTLMPHLILKKSQDKKNINIFMRNVLEKNIVISLSIYTSLFLALPFINMFFLQFTNNFLLQIISILFLGNLMNIISAIFYFYYLINGLIKIPLNAHILIGLLNFIIPLLYFLFFKSSINSGYWIVAAWSLSLFIGSFYIVYNFVKLNKGFSIPRSKFIWLSFIICFSGVILSQIYVNISIGIYFGIILFLVFAILIILLKSMGNKYVFAKTM